MPRVPPQEKTMSACPLRRLRSSEMTLHCNGMNLKDEIQSPCKENNIKSQSQLPRLVQIGHPSPGEDTLIASALSPKRKPRLALSPRKRMGDENGCNVDVSLQGSPPKRNNPAPCTLSSSRKLGFDENSLQSPTRGLVSVLLKQPSSPTGRLFTNRSKETPDGNSSCQQLEKKSQAFCLFAEKSRFQNVKQALHTAVPERLLSRETECKSIRSFLDKRVLQRNPASLYISGPPGTGKTACLNHVLQEMKDELMPIQIVEVNCMTLRNSHAIFPTLADKLGICGSHTEAKLQKILTTTGPTVLLVLDEMDQLDSKDHDVLYTIFEWPYLPKSRLCLIGIANALDLTDRILPRLQALPQCHPQLLNFSPYSRQELTSIVQDRLKRVSGEKLLDTSAIQFCARKVSAVSGDARKALDICRRAVEMVESNDRKEMPGSTAGTKVSTCGVPQVARVLSEVYGNCMTTSVNGEEESIPLQQKLLVCCLLLLTYNGKTKEMSLGKLHEVYSRLCDQRQVASVGQGECLSLCSLLESRGIFGLKKAKEARLTKISLKIEERDVESALKDRALLGSMLAAGLP